MASGAVSMACYAGEVPAASSTECGTSEGPLMAELKTVAELALMSDVDMSYDDDDDDNDDGGSGGVRGRGLMKPLSDDDDDDNGMSLRLPDRFAQELSKLEAAAVAAAAASAASAEAAAAAAAAAEAAAAGPVPAAMKLEEGARSAVGYFRKITATPVPSRPPMLVQEPLTAVEPCVPRAGEEQALTGESGLPVGGAAVAAAVVVTAVEKEEDEAVVGSGGEARSRGSRRPKSFFCRPCQFTTTSEAEFRHHISSHGAKKYLLEQQGETNVRTQAHTAAGGPIRCEKCGYNTNRYDHYLAHLKHHERVAGAALPPSPVVPPLRQPNEPRPSENRENRSAVAAPVLAPASAPVVEGGATVQSSERVFRCVLCLYSTVSEYHWKKHLRNHFPRKVYTCGSCCYYSDRKNNYLQHLRTHTGERPYQCPHCSYSSSQKTHLTRHMRIHSGEKPFHCDRCTYVASNQHEVTRHLRQVHSDGPKPLVCGECGYRTADRSNYKKHVLLHTSPRRFPCPACSYAASKKCNLTYHLHSKHPTYTGTATTAATMAATTTTVVTAARQQQPPPPMVSPAPPALSSSATSVKVEGASSKRSVVCDKSDTGSGGGCCTAKVNGVKREGRGRKRQGGAVAAAVAARGRAGGPPGVMGPAKETPEKKVKCEEKATAVGREASQPALPSPSSPRPPPAMMEEAGAELECEEVTSSIVKAAKRRGRRPSLKMAALAMEAEAPVGRSRRRGRKRKSKEEEQKGDDEGVKKLRNESEHVKGVVGKNAKKLKATVRKKAESVVMENRGGGYSRKKQQRNSEKIEAVPPTRKRKTTSGGDDTNEVNGREGATTAACPPSRRRGRRSKANVVVMLAADEEGEAASCERASEPPLPPSSTSPPLTQEAILAAGVIKQEVTPPVLPIPLKNQEVNDSTGAVTLLVKQAEEVTFLTNPTQEVTSLVQCTQEATSPVKQVPEVELPVPKSQPEVPHPPALSPLRHQPPYFSLKPEATTSVASGKQTRAAQRRRLSDKPQAFSGKRSQSPPALCMHDEEGSLQSTLKPADAVTSSRPRRVPAKRAPKRKINGGRKSVAKSWARNCGPVESPDSKPQPASCEGAVAATAAVVVVTARAEEMPAAGSPPAPSPPISGARSHLATCAGPSGAAGVGFLCRFAPEPNSGRTGWNQLGSDEDRGGPRMSDAFARALQLQRVDHRQQLQQQQQHLHRLYHLRSYLVQRERSYVHSSGAFDGASWLKVGTELCGARQCREAVAAVATAPPSTPSDDGMESPLSLDSDGPFTRHDYSTAHQQQDGRPRTSGDEGRGEMDEDEGIHSHDGRSSPERCFDDDEKERTGEEEEARARRKSERRRCRRRRQAFEQKPDLGGVCNVTPIISQLTTEVVPIPPPPPPAALPLPPEPLQKGPMLPLPWLRPSPGRSPVTPRGPVPPPPLQTRGMCVFCDRHCHGDADYTFRLRRNLVNVYYLERETAGQNVSNGDVEGDGGHCAGHHVGQGMKRAGEGDGEREGEKIAKNDGETGGKEDGERDEGNNGGRDRKKIREKDREKITDDAGGKDTELERVTGDANGKEDVVSQQCGHQKRTKEQSTQTVLSREDDTQTDVPREQDAKADAPREWCAQQDDASPKDRDVRSDSSREPDAHADAYRDQDTQTYILREQYTQTDACRAPGTQARGAREQETQTDLAVETS